MKIFFPLAAALALTTGICASAPASPGEANGLYSEMFNPAGASGTAPPTMQFSTDGHPAIGASAFGALSLGAEDPLCRQPPPEPHRVPKPPIVLVPEPSVYMLLGVGLLLCAQRFRKRHNS